MVRKSFLGSQLVRFGAMVSAAALAAGIGGCSKDEVEPNLTVEMRDAYAASSALYGYVWSPKQFIDKRNHKKILALIDSMSGNFHRVELAAPLTMFEPGFRLTLASHQQMLNDIRSRFEKGDADYANWRLRSLSANCVSCHSRYQVPIDFIGSVPPLEEASFEAEYARAQFLFATRQFDAAKTDLLRIAQSQVTLPTGVNDAFRALKLWLVIEVRVKEDFRVAAAALDPIIAKLPPDSDYREVLQTWNGELLELATRAPLNQAAPTALLLEAERLLNGRTTESTEREDELRLVTNLRASGLLHQALQQAVPLPTQTEGAQTKGAPIKGVKAEKAVDPTRVKRRATFLLGVSYARLPIDVFETFKELYLEQTIREFPESQEAQSSYLLYQDYIEEQSSGSGGLHLDAEQAKKLRELRNLAFGVHSGIRNDLMESTTE